MTLAVMAALGLSLGYSQLVLGSRSRRPPPVYSSLDGHHPSLLERSGQEVNLGQLKGKVVVLAHLYTLCHHGCATVLAEMKALAASFGWRADFHLVSVAVDPERDTATFFDGYARSIGVASKDPWWFLSGGGGRVEQLMVGALRLEKPRLIPEEERVNPLETHEHDLRLVLIDAEQRVRGYYSIVHPQAEIVEVMRKRLWSDVKTVLSEAGGRH